MLHYVRGVSRILSFWHTPFLRQVSTQQINRHRGGFDILEKKFWNFFRPVSGLGTSPSWFSGSAWFAASSSSLQLFKFLVWKPLHVVNLTKNLPCKVVFRPKRWIPTCSKPVKHPVGFKNKNYQGQDTDQLIFFNLAISHFIAQYSWAVKGQTG